jgi:hypothetical protein
MNTKIGIASLLVFLKDTNICTRKWYLERGKRVEKEGEAEDKREVEEEIEVEVEGEGGEGGEFRA